MCKKTLVAIVLSLAFFVPSCFASNFINDSNELLKDFRVLSQAIEDANFYKYQYYYKAIDKQLNQIINDCDDKDKHQLKVKLGLLKTDYLYTKIYIELLNLRVSKRHTDEFSNLDFEIAPELKELTKNNEGYFDSKVILKILIDNQSILLNDLENSLSNSERD